MVNFSKRCFLFVAFAATTMLNAAPTVKLGDATYTLTGQQSDEFVYSPEGADADAAVTMLTLVYDDQVKDEPGLKTLTDKIRDDYRAKGQLIKAMRVKNQDDAFRGFLVVAYTEFEGVYFAKMCRTQLLDQGGVAIIFEKEFAGEDSAQRMRDWFQANGRRMEAELLAFDPPAKEPLAKE